MHLRPLLPCLSFHYDSQAPNFCTRIYSSCCIIVLGISCHVFNSGSSLLAISCEETKLLHKINFDFMCLCFKRNSVSEKICYALIKVKNAFIPFSFMVRILLRYYVRMKIRNEKYENEDMKIISYIV